MDRHSRRLIDDYQTIILKDNLNEFFRNGWFMSVQGVRDHVTIIDDSINATRNQLFRGRISTVLFSKYCDCSGLNCFFLECTRLDSALIFLLVCFAADLCTRGKKREQKIHAHSTPPVGPETPLRRYPTTSFPSTAPCSTYCMYNDKAESF